ncbi:MAG TPA: sigma-70 family RNA polymerase sigma factor [Vicinamibacteria bacterium]
MATREMSLGSEPFVSAGAPDHGLVERCREGDPQAFARLVALHESMVFNLAARLLGDLEEARDVSQGVFLQVYRTLGKFEGRSSLKTWIYRIVVNQCHNRRRWWRRRAREKSQPIEDLTAAEEAQLSVGGSGASGNAFDRMRRAETAARVQEALLSLSFAHRTVLMLRDAEGLSCEAVAEALALPIGTVKSRLARAREALRTRLLSSFPQGVEK